ncbi:MAG: CcoQ/FixQ family Cbb3-type cytochrome c oxidase assembly chaperone [bacterium]|nr:CcoQ/FixQ family Cbb3-type cytochrome c oxidase assembly chaperone [bacterium]
MYQEFYSKSELLAWPLVGLVIFIAIFLGVLGYVFLGLKSKDKVDKIAGIPLEPDNEIDGHDEGRAPNNE